MQEHWVGSICKPRRFNCLPDLPCSQKIWFFKGNKVSVLLVFKHAAINCWFQYCWQGSSKRTVRLTRLSPQIRIQPRDVACTQKIFRSPWLLNTYCFHNISLPMWCSCDKEIWWWWCWSYIHKAIESWLRKGNTKSTSVKHWHGPGFNSTSPVSRFLKSTFAH